MIRKILLLFIVLLTASFAFAGNTYVASFEDASGNAVTGVDFEAFRCAALDNVCDTVTNDYYTEGNSGSTNSVNIHTAGTSYKSDYAFYFYKDGYMPVKIAAIGDSNGGRTFAKTLIFSQKDMCIAPITGVSVVNAVEAYKPITVAVNTTLEADTASAFQIEDSFPKYLPPSIYGEHRDLVAVTTALSVDVYREGVLVDTMTKVSDIFAGEVETINFTYIPKHVGLYTFEFKSYVTDNQCAATQTSVASDTTTVVASNDTFYSYSLLKDLDYTPVYPVAGDSLEANIDYLSNFINLDGSLTKVPTEITFTLREGYNDVNGLIVDQQSSTYFDSTSTEFATATYSETLVNGGWYTLVVNATPVKVGETESRQVYITFYVEGTEENLFSQGIYVRDVNGTPLDGVKGTLDLGDIEYSVNGRLQFSDLEAGTYSFNLTNSGYDAFYGSFTLTNANSSMVVYMTPTSTPPVIPTYNQTITVYDATTGLPLENVRSVIDTNDVKFTDVNGVLKHNDLRSGLYYYVLTLDGYEEKSGDFTIGHDNGLITVYMTPIIVPPVDYVLSLETLDNLGSPLDNVKGVLSNSDIEYSVNGDMEFVSLLPGTYNYVLTLDGFENYQGSVTIVDMNESQTVFMTPKVIPPLDLKYNHTLIVKDLSGNLLDNVRGFLINGDIEYSVNGNIEYLNLLPGTYTYELTKSGFLNYQGSFTIVNSNGVSTVYMTPIPVSPNTYSYTLMVSDLTGTPLNGVLGTLSNGDLQYTASGSLVFDNLMPGTYTYTLSLTGYEDKIGSFAIIDSNAMGQTFMIKEQNGNSTPVDPDKSSTRHAYANIDINFDAIDFASVSELDYVQLSVKNTGSVDIENAIVTVTFPELGVWDKVSLSDLDNGERKYKNFRFDMPADFTEGWYSLRVQVDGNQYNRARWYEVYLLE